MYTHELNLDGRLYNNCFVPALGGASVMGTHTMALIQTCQIQAITTVPQRLYFSAQLTNCIAATCWHVEVCTLSLLHRSFNIHSSSRFSCSCSFKFFQKYHSGWSWANLGCCLRDGVRPVSTFSCFHGRAFLGKPS